MSDVECTQLTPIISTMESNWYRLRFGARIKNISLKKSSRTQFWCLYLPEDTRIRKSWLIESLCRDHRSSISLVRKWIWNEWKQERPKYGICLLKKLDNFNFSSSPKSTRGSSPKICEMIVFPKNQKFNLDAEVFLLKVKKRKLPHVSLPPNYTVAT